MVEICQETAHLNSRVVIGALQGSKSIVGNWFLGNLGEFGLGSKGVGLFGFFIVSGD
jgi:hypothetical protein